MKLKRMIGAAAAGLSILALSGGSVLALAVPGTLDQEQAVTTDVLDFPAGYDLAQTFTAGQGGLLVAIGVYTGQFPQPAALATTTPGPGTDLGLAVVPTSGGLPDKGGTPLMDLEWTGIGTPGWYYFLVNPPATVVKDAQYAILMRAAGGSPMVWGGDCSDSYAGGQAYGMTMSDPSPAWESILDMTGEDYCTADFAFRTYITTGTPPPTTAVSSGPESTATALPLMFAILVVTASAAFVARRRQELFRR